MNLITATELRTKTPQIIATLLSGGTINIIHRSRIVGEIRPSGAEEKVFDAKKVLGYARKMDLPRLSYKEREKRYRQHLERKYGQSIS